MADSDKQRLADALAQMTAGETAPPAVSRPAAPSASSAPTASGAVIDDDDAVAPPPDPAKLGRHLTVGTTTFDSSLRFRRTIIPVLLTLGVLLPVTASLKWLAPRDSAFAAWPTALAVSMLIVGLLLLGAATMNMIQVRHMLLRERHVD